MNIEQLNMAYLVAACVSHSRKDRDSMAMLGVSKGLAELLWNANGQEVGRIVHSEFCLFRPVRINSTPTNLPVAKRSVSEDVRALAVSYLLSWKEGSVKDPQEARLAFGLSDKDAELLEGSSAAQLTVISHPESIRFAPRISVAELERQMHARHSDYDISSARMSMLLAAS